MYEPDGIATWKVRGVDHLITANEGDAREWDCYEEEARVKDLTLDPAVFPAATKAQLGRLNVTTTSPQGPNGYTELWSLGGRSVTVRDASGALVWDSGDLFERVTAGLASYNADNAETDSFDSRSDNKGPEPEGVAVGKVDGHAVRVRRPRAHQRRGRAGPLRPDGAVVRRTAAEPRRQRGRGGPGRRRPRPRGRRVLSQRTTARTASRSCWWATRSPAPPASGGSTG